MKKLLIIAVSALLCAAGIASAQKSRTSPGADERSNSSVKFADAAAVSDGGGVFLRWSTENEFNVIGYYVVRVGGVGGDKLSSDLVPGGYLLSRTTDPSNRDYSYFDADGDTSAAYYIETLEMNGKSRRFGPLTPQAVPDIRAFAGRSSAELRSDALRPKAVESVGNRIPSDLQKALSPNLATPNPTVQRWVARQLGAKIVVRQKGLYRVTRTQLEAAGFNVNAPSNLWQLYADGNEQGIIVGPGDSYIEFYGEGNDTRETDTRVYYLLVGSSDGKRIGTRLMRPISAPVEQRGFAQTFVKRERASYLSGILNGDLENFFSSQVVASTSTLSYNLTISGIDYSVPRSTVRVSLQGLTVSPHDIQVTINGQTMTSNITFNGQVNAVGTYEIDTSLLVAGQNTIQMRAFAGSNDFVVIDSVSVDYSRTLTADQDQLGFYTVNYKSAKLTGFTSANVRVFDLTEPDAVAEVTGVSAVPNGPTFDVRIPSHRARLLYAVGGSAVRTPVAVIANYPSTLSSNIHEAEMIIVTHRDLLAQAQNWASYRTTQGVGTMVIDVADIFDEYSYGSQNALAMTEFFQHARDNWRTGPQYVMLLGDATYDPKNYGNLAFSSWVPTELIDTLYEETGSDEALCDFNKDGLAEMSVGRIPARTGTEATQMLAKAAQFEGSLATAPARGALFVADQPIGYDFEGVNNRVAQQLPGDIPKTFISRVNPDARNLLIADLNQGRYLVNYSGHGSTLFWAASNFYHRNDLPLMTNPTNLSIFTLLTCLNGYFLAPTFDSFAETAVKTPNGGAVIAWASSGKTTPDIQEIMATRFYNQIGLGTIPRIGDLVKDAKESLVGGRDVRLSWTLFGDPAMRVR